MTNITRAELDYTTATRMHVVIDLDRDYKDQKTEIESAINRIIRYHHWEAIGELKRWINGFRRPESFVVQVTPLRESRLPIRYWVVLIETIQDTEVSKTCLLSSHHETPEQIVGRAKSFWEDTNLRVEQLQPIPETDYQVLSSYLPVVD